MKFYQYKANQFFNEQFQNVRDFVFLRVNVSDQRVENFRRDPGKVGLSTIEIVLKCVNECGKKRPGLQPAGLSNGKNSFHPAVAFFTGDTLGAL
jgi:hypothetical protein